MTDLKKDSSETKLQKRALALRLNLRKRKQQQQARLQVEIRPVESDPSIIPLSSN